MTMILLSAAACIALDGIKNHIASLLTVSGVRLWMIKILTSILDRSLANLVETQLSLPSNARGENIYTTFLQDVSITLLCKPCTSYDRDVRLSVHPSHADIV